MRPYAVLVATALFLLGVSGARAVPTPAVQFDVGLTATTSTTQTGPAHVVNGGLVPNTSTRWNALGAATEYGTAVDAAAGALVSASGETLASVGVDFGVTASSAVPWMPTYATSPLVRYPGQVGVYNNSVMRDMVCFNANSPNLASFARITGLAEGLYAVYSMHRNGYQTYPSAQTACIVAGTSTTDLTAAGKTTLTYSSDADTTSWVVGRNCVLSVVEVTAAAPDVIVGSYSTQNNQKGCINAIQVVPLELAVGFTATDTTHCAGVEWRTPCTVQFGVTGSTGTSPTFTWNWGIDPAQKEVMSSATASYTFTNPGTYTVRLQVVDADGKAGLAIQTLVLTGNAQPVANAGTVQVGYVGDALSLSASASTDPNAGDTLSYLWTQLAGTPATLSSTASATPTYTGTAPSTNVFQVTVSDNGDPVRSSTAVVTNYVYATFKSAVMIDFGPRDPSAASATQKTNAPAHADGVLTAADTVWIGYTPAAGDNGTLSDLMAGAVDSKGAPVGLTVDLGRNNSLVPNYANQPFQRQGNMGGGSGYGVFNSNIHADFLQANDSSWRSFVRLSGFAPGAYGVYLTARNTFNSGSAEYHYVRAGAGNAATQLVSTWNDDDKTGFANTTERDSTTWTKGKNYRFVTVNVSEESRDIVIVSQYCSSASDVKGGVINTIQVVPIVLNAAFTSSADGGARAPVTVDFDASASTGSDLTYTWSWGDGSANGVHATPTASHLYELPGTYNVTLQITDSNNQIGTITRSITLTGNHVPVAEAGTFQYAYLKADLAMPLDATASSDADAGDTLSYAWTQELGPSVGITGATSATASYQPVEAGTYVFRMTVSDNGDPVRASSAVVTNLVFAYFKQAVNLDFGTLTPPVSGNAVATNAPAFVAGTLKPELDTWFKPSDAEDSTGSTYPVADLLSGATAADGNPVGLVIDYGRSAGASWTPNWNSAPAQRGGFTPNDRGVFGVYNNTLGTDFLFGTDKLYLRLRGFLPGLYDVYVASRNIFAISLQQAVRIGVGDGSTVLDGDWTEAEKLAAYTADNVAAVSAAWVKGQTYVTKTVRVTGDAPDILVIGGFLSGSDNKGGVVNLLQVVPRSEPGSIVFIR